MVEKRAAINKRSKADKRLPKKDTNLNFVSCVIFKRNVKRHIKATKRQWRDKLRRKINLVENDKERT